MFNDSRVSEKKQEKIEKYQELRWEVVRLWKMKKVKVIPVVVVALGTITNWTHLCLKKTEVELMQKTALLGTARILRKVLDA